jgi:uncharacterized membrane-anchored protein
MVLEKSEPENRGAGMSHSVEATSRQTIWNRISLHQKSILVGAVIFQTLVLVSMIVQSARPLVTGQTILVRVIPVDPRDLFRGDYVILNYDFTTSKPSGAMQDDPGMVGSEIFVSLVRDADGKHWKTESITWTRPTSGTWIRGSVDQSLRNEFGIGQYFVQEGQGREYEDAILSQQLSAELAVTADGAASIKRLVIE